MATIPQNVFPHGGSDPAASVRMESGQSNPWGGIPGGTGPRAPVQGADPWGRQASQVTRLTPDSVQVGYLVVQSVPSDETAPIHSGSRGRNRTGLDS